MVVAAAEGCNMPGAVAECEGSIVVVHHPATVETRVQCDPFPCTLSKSVEEKREYPAPRIETQYIYG